MRKVRLWGAKSPTVIRLLLAGAGASVLAGCADSTRFSDPGDPLGNPFRTSSSRVDRSPTASVNPPPMRAPASAPIQSRSLAAPQPQADYSNYGVPANPSPKLASAQPVSPRSDVTASTGRTAQGMAGWSANGGTPVVVANGETLDTISNRYGVPRDAIIRTNGFASASDIRPGTRLIVPVYNASLAASSGASPAAISRHEEARREEPRHDEKMKFVRGAEPASMAKPRVAQAEMKPAKAEPAKTMREQKLAAKEQSPAKQAAAPAVVAQKQAPLAQQAIAKREMPKVEPMKTAKVEQAPLKPVDQTPTASLPPQEKAAPQQTASNEAANPEFRWPARGRVIQGFKAGGNDGINISVPEGTAVKAAEGGVVAYAGNELKGYGNLVLIRHPNGFVSAYANNGDIEVKRGETVKRGQVIAKSGQSGNVSSPQLHFELRKGSTPVDPSQYLAGL